MKVVVFDLDGMVYHTDEPFSVRFSREYKVPIEDVLEFFKKDFERCQTGEADLKECLMKYTDKWGWKGSVEELMQYWFSDGHIKKDVAEIIEKLKKQGVKCILCTNNEKHRIEYLKKKNRIGHMFDSIVASYNVGARKPEKAIFDRVRQAAGCEPKEIVFCDDKKKNISAAKEYGFRTFLYDSLSNFKEFIQI